MKTNLKRITAVLTLCLCMLLAISLPALAKSPAQCGSGLTWQLTPEGLLKIDGTGSMYDWSADSLPPWYASRVSIAAVQLPEGLTHIGAYAFSNCTGLNTMTLPNSVKSIGEYAFRDCSIQSIDLPRGLREIEFCGFWGCDLKSVALPSGLQTIEIGVFGYCNKLASVTIPDSVSKISDNAFMGIKTIPAVYYGGTQRDWSGVSIGREGNDAILNSDVICAPEPPDQALTAVKSNNIHSCNYPVWRSPLNSFLYSEDGFFYRVEYISNSIVVEKYSDKFKLLSSKTIECDESAHWCGFFHGDGYNYVALGHDNPDESDAVEVLRFIKYSSDWERLDEAVIFGANTKEIGGYSMRFAEYNGMLYVHTGHSMYKSPDGRNHQSNMTISIRESDMTVTDLRYGVFNVSAGYVSHSFNQYIMISSDGYILTCDHGDAYPRSIIINRYREPAGGQKFLNSNIWDSTDSVDTITFPGAIGDNQTGASLGGLAETKTGYITAYNYNGVGTNSTGNVMGYASSDVAPIRNVYLSYTPKADFSEAKTVTIPVTSYPSDGSLGAGTPLLVPMGTDVGYLLWEELEYTESGRMTFTGKLSYAAYAQDGTVSKITTVDGALSDCQPVVLDGKAVWYVTEGDAPLFYVLDQEGLHTVQAMPFSDVDEGAYYYDAVSWAYQTGVTTGKSSTEFGPGDAVTRAQAVTFLWRAMDRPGTGTVSKSFEDVAWTDYFMTPVEWAVEKGITNGTAAATFSPDQTCSTAHILTFLYRTLGIGPDGWYEDAAAWARREGLIDGTGVEVNPDVVCTRADIVTFLYRALSQV